MKYKRNWFVLLFVVVGLFMPKLALAHPLNNFSINQYSRLEVGSTIKVFYALDVAEIPTLQERQLMDYDKNNQVTKAEQNIYLEQKIKELQGGLKLRVDGKPIELSLKSKEIAFLVGSGGMLALRIAANFESPALAATATQLNYEDANFPDKAGWKEVIARNATGASMLESNVPDKDRTNELLTYPADVNTNLLNVRTAQITFQQNANVVTQPNEPTLVEGQREVVDVASLPTNFGELSGPVILAGLIGAIISGMFVALSPGHGKTAVIAYLAGSRATIRHSLFLGLTVAFTHTMGVILLGVLILLATQFILPEKLYSWLNLISGLLLLTVGLTVFSARLRKQPLRFLHSHHTHQHEHDEHCEHDLPPGSDGTPVTWRQLLMFGISAGILPCPTALMLLLGAIALNQIAFGVILVIFFGFGLTITLVSIGLVLIYSRKLILESKLKPPLALIQVWPVVSAAFVVLIGVVVSYEALIKL